MMKSKIIKAFISIATMAVLIFNTSIAVLATPNEDLIKTQGEVYSLNTAIEKLTDNIKKNEEDLKVVLSEVETSQKEIVEKEAKIQNQEEMLSKRVRELYKTGGQNNYIIMLLKAEGFTDFVTKMVTVSKIVDLDKKVVAEIKDSNDELALHVTDLEKKSIEIITVTEENKKSLADLESKKKEQELLVSQMLAARNSLGEAYLVGNEKAIISYQLKVLKESNSLEELQAVIGQLINIRDKQIKNQGIIDEINNNILEATKRVSGLEQYLKEKGNSVDTSKVTGSTIVSYAYQFLGKPYVIAGNGPDVFDCSGLTRYVYQNVTGKDITRTTYSQIKQGTTVAYNDLQLGDLVFVYGVEHVGIYVGGGSYIHAPQPGENVQVSQITSFTEGRRIISN
ncbi:MAG: NlpC/P60 family protein [Clostridium sp.]